MLSPPTLTGAMPAKTSMRADMGRIDIGQRRIHVVGAGRDQVHAVDLDAQAVIGQAADRRQAGDAAGAIQGQPRNAIEQSSSIRGRCRFRLEFGGGERGFGLWQRGDSGADHLHGMKFGGSFSSGFLLGAGSGNDGDGNGHGQRELVVSHGVLFE